MVQRTRSKKRAVMSKTRKVISIKDIRDRFKDMDESVRGFFRKMSGGSRRNGNSKDSLVTYISRQWSKLFKKPITSQAAKSLSQYYTNLYGKKKGGSAPLDYEMRPGMPAVMTYGTFPTEVGADPKAVQNLDVYYNSALGRSCGSEDTSAKVAPDMGSNLVPAKGGTRHSKRNNKRTTQKRGRKQGGNFASTLNVRPYVASNPTHGFQQSMEIYNGLPANPADARDPSVSNWEYMAPSSLLKPPTDLSTSSDLTYHSRL